MPTTTRIFVKTSIVYLGLGAVLGALMLIQRWVPLGPAISHFKISHVQFLIVGWLTQFILGVAWWLFPPLEIGLRRDALGPVRRGQAQRGSERLFWVTFVCLNLGVVLRAVFDPLYSVTQSSSLGLLSSVSGLFLLAAALAFVVNTWGRVRALGK